MWGGHSWPLSGFLRLDWDPGGNSNDRPALPVDQKLHIYERLQMSLDCARRQPQATPVAAEQMPVVRAKLRQAHVALFTSLWSMDPIGRERY